MIERQREQIRKHIAKVEGGDVWDVARACTAMGKLLKLKNTDYPRYNALKPEINGLAEALTQALFDASW